MNKESASLEPGLQLPEASESLQDKVQRFNEHFQSESTVDEQMSASTGIIAPSERNSHFTNEEMNSLHKLFKDMITENKKICRVEIEERLSSSKEGEKILNKLSVTKVVNRVKYERLKHRRQQK